MSDPRRILTGLRIHRDVKYDYSFWRPLSWYRHDMQEQYGFIYSPGPDSRTGFYVAVQDLSGELDEPISEADLPALHEGMLNGLKSLPDCVILAEKEVSKGPGIGFEVMLTFTLDGETCQRLMRLLYYGRRQFTVFGQGLPTSEYQVFHDTYEFIYSTFVFGDLLAMTGIPQHPSSATVWQGDAEQAAT